MSENRLIGYGIMYSFMVYSLFYVLFKNGAAGWFGDSIHLPTYVMVLGLGLGFKIMQKHLLAKNELGSSLKKNIIIAGWIGFMMSLVFWDLELLKKEETIILVED